MIPVGAICNDGTKNKAVGRGTCSKHGGVKDVIYEKVEVWTGGTGKYKEIYENSKRNKDSLKKKEAVKEAD